MLQITPHMRVLLAVTPVDFRKGIDGLARLCLATLEQDPFSGTVFVFRNRRSTAIKVLLYDGQGYWLCQKRLSCGKFAWWPNEESRPSQHLAAHQLHVLFSAGNPTATGAAPDWRPLAIPSAESPRDEVR